MSSNSKRHKDLLHRLMILEKFIELKSNECAYYRSKVHLMQINSTMIDRSLLNDDEEKQQQQQQQLRKSISDETEIEADEQAEEFESNSTTNDLPERKSILKSPKESTLPIKTQWKSPFVSSAVRRYRKTFRQRTNEAVNQNYADELVSHTDNPNLVEQTLDYNAKSHRQSTRTIDRLPGEEKAVQCNPRDFTPNKSLSDPSLIIELPRRFIESFISEQKRKPHRPKLKVQFSSDLIQKLAQSAPSLTTMATTTVDQDYLKNKAVYARVEMKTRSPSIRHLCRTKSVQLNGKIHPDVVRQKKRHIHRWKISSADEHLSASESLSNVTQVQDTTSSSNDENIA